MKKKQVLMQTRHTRTGTLDICSRRPLVIFWNARQGFEYYERKFKTRLTRAIFTTKLFD